jgi:hypothetical protein
LTQMSPHRQDRGGSGARKTPHQFSNSKKLTVVRIVTGPRCRGRHPGAYMEEEYSQMWCAIQRMPESRGLKEKLEQVY